MKLFSIKTIILLIIIIVCLVTERILKDNAYDNLYNKSKIFFIEIENNFGNIDKEKNEGINIIGSIPFNKHMGFSIIIKDGVKTIRVYRNE